MEVRDKKLKNTLKDCKKPNILVKPERGKSLKKYIVEHHSEAQKCEKCIFGVLKK